MSRKRKTAATPTTSRLGLYAAGALALAAIAALGWWYWGGDADAEDVVVPSFSRLAAAGEKAYRANCAQCHGVNGVGTDRGPPLLHKIYNPGHHGDGAFVRAVRAGVRAHHWRFGNMPPQPQVTDAELQAIIAYVRELQIANGIVYEPHNM